MEKSMQNMEDQQIIGLYFDRNEQAITATKTKYGRLLISISMRILHSMEDADECENDTYMRTWNAIPPQIPDVFSAFLSKIVRNLSLDRYDQMTADKRGGGETAVILDELEECVADEYAKVPGEESGLKECLNAFLETENTDARKIFVRRYFFGYSVKEIAERYDITESKTKMSLMRSRNRLKEYLEKEGVTV